MSQHEHVHDGAHLWLPDGQGRASKASPSLLRLLTTEAPCYIKPNSTAKAQGLLKARILSRQHALSRTYMRKKAHTHSPIFWYRQGFPDLCIVVALRGM